MSLNLRERKEHCSRSLLVRTVKSLCYKANLSFWHLRERCIAFSLIPFNRSDFVLYIYVLRCFPRLPQHKQNGEGYALMQLLQKTLSQFTWLDQQQILSDKFFILKFLFNELKQFYSSTSLEKLFFRAQVRVWQNNRVFQVHNPASKS